MGRHIPDTILLLSLAGWSCFYRFVAGSPIPCGKGFSYSRPLFYAFVCSFRTLIAGIGTVGLCGLYFEIAGICFFQSVGHDSSCGKFLGVSLSETLVMARWGSYSVFYSWLSDIRILCLIGSNPVCH